MNDALKLAKFNARVEREREDRKLYASVLLNPAFQCLAVAVIADQAVKHNIIEPTTGKGFASLYTGVTIATHSGGLAAAAFGALGASAVTGNTAMVPPGTSWWDKMFKYDKWPWES